MNDGRIKSAVERAEEFGIDITLIMENLKRSPNERLRHLQEWMFFAEELRKARQKELLENKDGTY